MMLSGTITSQCALGWQCPEPTTNTQDYLHSPARPKAHSCTRHINRITPIHSLSQINPLPAPQAGRTRARAPQGATFSQSQSSLGTENPPLAPAEDGCSFRPWATVPRPVASSAEPQALHQLNTVFLFPAALLLVPTPAKRRQEPCFQLPFLPATVQHSQGRWWSQNCPQDVGHY